MTGRQGASGRLSCAEDLGGAPPTAGLRGHRWESVPRPGPPPPVPVGPRASASSSFSGLAVLAAREPAYLAHTLNQPPFQGRHPVFGFPPRHFYCNRRLLSLFHRLSSRFPHGCVISCLLSQRPRLSCHAVRFSPFKIGLSVRFES